MWRMILLVCTFVALSASTPVITQPPVNTNVTEGDSVSFDCVTDTAVNITWFLNNREVICNIGSCIIYGNNTLLFDPIGIWLAGNYSCAVLDGNATIVRSSEVYLKVLYIRLFGASGNLSAQYDSLFTKHCYARGFPMPLSITWKFNGNVISNDSRRTNLLKFFETTTYSTLKIINITATDIGIYTCEADNGAGKLEHNVGSIVNFTKTCMYGWTCPNIRQCIKRWEHCDNRDNCGDLTDETVNCSAPGEIKKFKVVPYLYHTLRVSWGPYDRRVINYTLMLKDGDKMTMFVLRSFDTRIENLQNGTTYQLQVFAENYAGRSNTTGWINATLPRLVTPGAVRHINARYSVWYTYVTTYIRFTKPLDDGGSRYPKYHLNTCLYNELSNTTSNCTSKWTSLVVLIKDNQLPETTYKVTIYVENEAKQKGPSVDYIYTTPPYRTRPVVKKTSTGMSVTTIIGIVIPCVSALFAILGFLFKKCSDGSSTDGQYVESVNLENKTN